MHLQFQTHAKAFGGLLKQPWMTMPEPGTYYSSLLQEAGFEVLQCESKVTTDYLTENELRGLNIVRLHLFLQKRKPFKF